MDWESILSVINAMKKTIIKNKVKEDIYYISLISLYSMIASKIIANK